jgi:hypothetical protein
LLGRNSEELVVSEQRICQIDWLNSGVF